MILKSTSVLINENQENIFLFLSDSSNLFHILPKESISDWKANLTECSFKVQGGVVISLVQDGFEGKSKPCGRKARAGHLASSQHSLCPH